MEQQKYTEGVDFETDEWFLEELNKFPSEYRIEILADMLQIMSLLPTEDGWSQVISGVIRNPEPIFYKVEYLKQNGELPYLIAVAQIDSDEYLDAVLENNTIEFYGKGQTN